jgi:hypothetical protein
MSRREVYIFHINFNSLHVCFDAPVPAVALMQEYLSGGGGRGGGGGLQLVTLIP